jgi:2-desacetyl-2-hydroxyethyl bacteriochlorophyllide A dehydrogenase
MKAAVIRGPLTMKVEERPMPSFDEGGVLVRVRAAGICGSDIHGFLGKSGTRRLPGLVIGHEAAGEVVEVGSRVEGLAQGDRVAIDPQISCGSCDPCRRGYANLCDNMLAIGSSMRKFFDGAMCEYIALPARQFYRLPPQVSYTEGAMLDPVGNSLHVFNRAEMKIGDIVAIVGAGTIGLILVQLALRSGAGKVIAVDVSGERLKLAKDFGADVLVRANLEDSVARIMEETAGSGADIVIESAGPSATYGVAVRSARKRGKVMALGFSDAEVAIPTQSLLFREITIIGCSGFVFECRTAIELLAAGRVNVKPLITHEYPIDDVQRAFTEACDPTSHSVKSMIIP